MDTKDIAAFNLVGQTLNATWVVKQRIDKEPSGTGGFFSVCYLVEDRLHNIFFLKAFNINAFKTLSKGKSWMDYMKEMTDAYLYEKKLSEYCQQHHVTKVSFVIDSGEIELGGYTFPIVPYLVFEMADGDVRRVLNNSQTVDLAWKLHSLHDIAVAIQQLHNIQVSHQDLKPSNILLFKEESKVGDLGRSTCAAIDSQYNLMPYSGDLSYAPFEILYNQPLSDSQEQFFATDCYLLGSLITFYIAGISMTALITEYIRKNNISLHGNFISDLPYLQHAFNDVIGRLELSIPIPEMRNDISSLIRYLCEPDPTRRGHPKNISSRGSNYDLHRFVASLDALEHKTRIAILKKN